MSTAPSLLIVEDDELLATAYAEFLSQAGCTIRVAGSGDEALARHQDDAVDVLLLDLGLPDMHGLELLNRIREGGGNPELIIVTSEDRADSAMEAVRQGAYDYMVKPVDRNRLELTVGHLLERLRLERRLHRLAATECEEFEGFVGASPPMQVVYRIIENVAASDATVFVTGESGTGKELCAEAIHRRSARNDGELVTLNCAAIPQDLLESEVFGHVKGAFTGAVSARVGAAARADGGTLFLDEICDMPLDLQSKLLRFVQTRRFQRVGGSKEESSDVRFVCATNRDPWAEVEAGRFREDLYYRLFVVPLRMPPLREREDDVLRLANHFLQRYAAEEGKRFDGLSRDARDLLLDNPLPGNVRQLQNLIRRVVVLYPEGEVTAERLSLQADGNDSGAPPSVVSSRPNPGVEPPRVADEAAIRPLLEVEREAIEHALRVCNGHVGEAARSLGISDSTIYRKQAQWKQE
ncbi:MAG: sigma-54-dependent transcriptional regulator [Pseudomonadota bacterium]